MVVRYRKLNGQDTYTNSNNSRWAYIQKVNPPKRKIYYYVASGLNTSNNATKTFNKKSDAIKYARRWVSSGLK